MNLKHYLWTTPFLSFLLGYSLLHIFLKDETIATPQLIGIKVDEALTLLTAKNLNLRIIAHTEDKDLEEGIILSQTPHHQQTIKPHQSIFVVVSKKPPKIEVPSIGGLTLNNAQKKLAAIGLSHKQFTLQTSYPHNTIIAQVPAAHNFVSDHKMISYVSSDNEKPVVFPDLQGKLVSEVTEFLHIYGIIATVYHTKQMDTKHVCTTCIVKSQKPLAGSLVNLDKPLSVQVEI